MKVITFANQKGGVGKSTAALAVGCGLLQKGYSVLFIDLDQQCNLSFMMHYDPTVPTVYDAMKGDCKVGEALQKTPIGSLVAGSPGLAAVDLTFTFKGKEQVMKRLLEKFHGGAFDYIVLDTPPALGVLTVNSLVACDYLVIPAQADALSMQGIAQLYDTFDAVRTYHNPELKALGIVLTRFDNRTILTRRMAELFIDAARRYGTTVLKSTLRETIVIKEAQAQQLDLFDYAPRSNAAVDCMAVTEELLSRMR